MATHRKPMPREVDVTTNSLGHLQGYAVGLPVQEFGVPDGAAHDKAARWLSELLHTGAYFIGYRSEITTQDVEAWRRKHSL